MILFKRVGDSFRHIEDREWVLLFLETLGVLVGILLAFALQEWAQQRGEAAKHRLLMERLFDETEFDVAVLRSMRDSVQGTLELEKRFAVAISKGECPPTSDWKALDSLALMPAVTAPASVYEELIGAGGLSSVDNRDVQLDLAEFHGNLDWVQQQIAYFRANQVKVLTPSDSRVRVTFDPAQEEPEVWTYDRSVLCTDQGFRNRVAAATRAHVVYASFPASMTDRAVRMCADLGETLGRSCMAGTPTGAGGPLTGADAKLARDSIAYMHNNGAKKSLAN